MKMTKQNLLQSMIVIGLLASSMSEAIPAQAEEVCHVTVCNKLSRLTLNPISALKDHFGETCSAQILPKNLAHAGTVLSSSSRWWQGSLNPTKKSVTYVKTVGNCGNLN